MTTPNLTDAVAAAIEDIRTAFLGHRVDVEPDGDGGAYVTVQNLFIGKQYEPSTSWIGFRLTFQYPEAGIYPHHTTAGLRRVDGNPLGEAFHPNNQEWKTPSRHEPSTMLSRKSHNWDAYRDTAATKLQMVLEWLRSR